MLEEVVDDLPHFVEPGIDREVDLSRGFEFLDKELAVIAPGSEQTSRVRMVDKLVKMFLRDGGERWMLLHVEVQGSNEVDFSKRMFQYYYRIVDRHDRPVAAIAVFTGRLRQNIPSSYEDRCLWARLKYEYKALCIADYPDVVLEESDNPFAMVCLVAKEALLQVEGGDDKQDAALLEQKLRIVRLLKAKLAIFGEKKAAAVLTFLNNYVAFKRQETNLIFMERVDQITGKKNTMGVLEQLAEIRHQEGVEEGKVQEKENLVRTLLTDTNFSARKIAGLVGVSVAFVNQVNRKLSVK